MKKLLTVAFVSLFFANIAGAQWCAQPNPNFCPGNRFSNGDFETITGDPQAQTDQDINLASGWGSVFTNGLAGASNADLACAGNALCGGTVPMPNTGGVYAGMWIQNSGAGSNANFREQMYNRLVNPIAANTGFYSFTCDLAASCQNNVNNTIDIAVYGVLNTTNALANNTFTALYTPSDLTLWSATPSVQVVLLGTITTPAGLNQNWQNVSFTFNSNILPSGGITHIMITRSPTPSTTFRKKFIMFDNFCMQETDPPVDPARGCCDDLDESNLIPNGSFESGNTGFSSPGYTYQGLLGPNSISEGMYSVVTGAQAGIVSNCWNIADHTTCNEEEGHFMVVNGRTHNPQSTMVYQQSNIPVEEGEEYIFCMYYQHLPQCAFDVFDPRNMHVGVGPAELQEGECEDDEDHCGWTKISYTVIPQSNTLNIEVFLDEGGIGDGNDVAFDDFSLRKKGVMPSDYCAFDISSSTSGSNITLNASAITNPLPAGFNVEWNVTEADCNTWAPIGGTSMTYAWDPYNTNFPGYCCIPGGGSPGAFSTTKCYIITRKVTNCCYTDCEYKFYLSAQPQGMMMGKQTGNEEGTTFYISSDLKNWQPIGNTSAAATKDLTIYPNPGDGKVIITSKQPLEGSELTIYNVESKVILKQSFDNSRMAVDISKLPNGVYTFKVTDGDGNTTTKNYVKQ